MPRKKGVARVGTLLRLTPDEKKLLDHLAGLKGWPNNIYVGLLIQAEAAKAGLRAIDLPDKPAKGEEGTE